MRFPGKAGIKSSQQQGERGGRGGSRPHERAQQAAAAAASVLLPVIRLSLPSLLSLLINSLSLSLTFVRCSIVGRAFSVLSTLLLMWVTCCDAVRRCNGLTRAQKCVASIVDAGSAYVRDAFLAEPPEWVRMRHVFTM